MKRMLGFILTISIFGIVLAVLPRNEVAASVGNNPSSYNQSNFDLSLYKGEYNFAQFMEDHRSLQRPNTQLTVDLEVFQYAEGLFENDQPYIDYFKDDHQVEKEGVYLPESGNVTFSVEVAQAGLYQMNIEYYTILGRGASIHRGIMINGEYQYFEAEKVVINRFWRDEFNVDDRRVDGINDLRPKQVEVHLWNNSVIEDLMGYYNMPYYFKLTEGVNTITFVAQREPIVFSAITLQQNEDLISYENYIRHYEQIGAEVIDDDFNLTIQAEHTHLKSSPTLNPTAEFSTYKFEPYVRFLTRYNAIGGYNWRIPGDEISWEIEVPKSGMYLVNLKVMQNFSRGKNSTRVFKVNGKVPFEEASSIEIKYDSDLQNKILGDQDGHYLIYFDEGVNTISLTSTIGIYGEIVNQVNVDIKKLRSIYREIVMRTGLNPDPLQDYMLHRNVSMLDERLNELLRSLNHSRDAVIAISNGRSELVSTFDRTILQLERFIDYEKNIQKGLREFEQNITALASWVMNVSEQPLIIDEITIMGTGHNLPRVSTNFFEKIWHEIILFIGSFRDIGDFGSSHEVDGPTITVWTGTGRDQTTILRQLIDESFIQQNQVNVELKMVDMNILLSASLSGNGPDVALGVNQKLPVNWGIRGAIKDLTEFDDFESVVPWFSPSSMQPLGFDGKFYALPSTEDFLIMFYREDILKEIGISKIPETWDEVIDISPVLQKQYLDFYIPVVQGTMNETLHAMILQSGGQLYNDDFTEVALLEPNTTQAFLQYVSFFTNYGFVLEANFLNRFRSGEMPIGISNFTLYNSLAVFAPEIQGQWDYTLMPGTIRENGEIDHSTTSIVSGSIILNDTKEMDASWEFLKWFHSDDVQRDYARGIESILGAAARYPTANMNAFAELSWPAKDYIMLERQRSFAQAIPTVPGDYIVGRHIDNAFRLTLNENILPQNSLYQYYLVINEEVTRKRKELGLD